jgi:RNA polymerase sigma-70 factor (ECF subfamily)
MTVDQEVHRRQWVLTTIEQYEGRLTRYAARLLGDADTARDAVQHAFLCLCDEDPDRIGDGIAAWLFTVCRNKAMDIARSKKRVKGFSDEAMHLACRDGDPASTAENIDLHELLLRLVDGLPFSQREALDLWSQGFNYRQIANVTDRTEGAVRVLVHRGLTRLRKHPWTQAILED